ncbi:MULTISPECIES: nucleotidyltransferase domain-containing protein [Enterobacteriaceae]|uniref:nucleotidyltransferase domain-containing protein n=1 Tax=Enterobacteriaceae TaxID=543 RepID=UPI000EF9ABC8|nr:MULTISPECIES: nucleotidyltransferase domain-containing protein [Enterobacteriaceae]RMA88150.1 hypothetical protein BJ885_0057 [Enterobacter sp. WP_7_1]RMA98123.1 hypothetical protein BJ886_0156 [Enterobacter sp. WP_7_2]ROX08026.1 nucleotidyltransferase [Escherichia coli]HAW3884805.1 nucleotidyltransferase [Escherichia coli]
MHIYAFGSVCRGEIDVHSDVDMLAIVNGKDTRFNPNDYSIYSYDRIKKLWNEGNPFAWHLFLEAKMVFSSDGKNFLRDIGCPSTYKSGLDDCRKFLNIFLSAKESIQSSRLTEVFDLSTIFLSVRNFATCYSLSSCECADFSRNSAKNLGEKSLKMSESSYRILERARVLSTRGVGIILNEKEIIQAKSQLNDVELWMNDLIKNIEGDNCE